MITRKMLAILGGTLLLTARWASADTIDFEKQIRPIFAQSCYKCHAGAKHKGDLKLDSLEAITKGGKDGPVLAPKDAEKSDLYHRIILSKDDDDRMPPKGDPLAKDQTELVKQWIAQGASFGAWKADSADVVAKLTGGGKEEAATQIIKEIELPKVSPADPSAVDKVQQTGALCMKLAQDTNLLDVEFQLAGPTISDAQVALLSPLAQQVIWLNLANTKVTDSGLATLEQLKNLRRLHLEKTGITDAGLVHLKGLANLEYLNLYGTSVTDEGIAQLAELKNLREVYVWQSKVTEAGAQSLHKQLPTLLVNTGWHEPPPATAPAHPAK